VTAITYRDAVTRGIAQEMRRDPSVVFLGEDVAAAGGVFKTTPGLLEQFGPERVRDTPISEQAILGAAIGAAMTGLRPIAEIMFSDFFAVCWDLIANEMAKIRYMSDGQLALPLVVRCANGAGLRFGAQHSQSVENWAMAVPGLKVVAPSNPRDVIGLFAAAVRDPDPVLFFEHKGLYPSKGEVPDGEITDELGRASVLRQGGDATILALAAMVPRTLAAAEKLSAEDGIEATVIDVRSLVPLDTRTILAEVTKTGRLFTVEENPRLCGWGAEIVSIVAEEAFGALTGPAIRITTPHIPLPAADKLEDHVLPSVDRIVETVSKALLSPGTPPVTPARGDPSPRTPSGGQGPRNSSGGHMADNLAELVGIDVPTRLLIGGEWTGGRGGGTLSVIDPATEDALAEVADGTVEDALDAVGAAAGALPGWAATPPRQRAECLRRTFELMTEHAESLARLMVAENGKALRDARGEATYAAEFFRWYAEEAVRMEGVLMQAPSGANKILVMRQPAGVSVLVTPWNFPAAMATRKIGPALAAGCTVVLKPASETPLTALAIAGLLAEAGVPDGVVNVLPSRKSGAVVSAMLNDPRVRKLSFTGSTEVGRILLREAADTVVNTSMELGGNAPFIIFQDADIDAAIEGALLAKMRNGGEACTAANRFYVHEAVADEFSRKFAARLEAMVVGPGLDEGTEVGPLVNEPTRSKVAELVESAAADGGKVVTGGRAPDRRGYFYQPTVIDQVPSGAAILGTEIFGPVAPVVRFTAEDEAVRWANDTEFGLVSYVYTGDLSRGLRVSEALEAGMVGLNRGIVSDPAAPFGGVKQSGIGREGAHDGLLEFTETKYIATNW
jgi:succinate-semialdehyde dehydrogenase / glutarate-semialdehyde dehydrogenase